MLLAALSEAARRALKAMNLPKYEYKTDFAKRYYGQGLAEGLTEGRAQLILKQLELRFGEVPETTRSAVQGATIEELDRIGARLLTAACLDEVLDGR